MTDEEALDLLAQLRQLLCEAHSLANVLEKAGVTVEISHEVTHLAELGRTGERRIHRLGADATRRLGSRDGWTPVDMTLRLGPPIYGYQEPTDDR